jgi:glutathione synthase/RimK-type ligase-like ATP-grasp enzyme
VIDDDLAIAELARRDWAVDEIPWRRRAVPWRDYTGVVIRTPWDYQKDPVAFLEALDAIAAAGVPLANPVDVVRWNLRKSYLRDLAQRGVPIVPTRWGTGLDRAAVAELAGAYDGEFIVKPVVSANADDTFRLAARLDDATVATLLATFTDRAWMAQPFVDSVIDEGEWSLFWFGGRFSHAIRKVPARGDFRVQEEHGGIITAITPEPALLRAAEQVMATLDDTLLQARVDLVRLADGSFALMELEIIEPSLYFRMHPRAPHNFADAIERWLADR